MEGYAISKVEDYGCNVIFELGVFVPPPPLWRNGCLCFKGQVIGIYYT